MSEVTCIRREAGDESSLCFDDHPDHVHRVCADELVNEERILVHEWKAELGSQRKASMQRIEEQQESILLSAEVIDVWKENDKEQRARIKAALDILENGENTADEYMVGEVIFALEGTTDE